MKRLISVAPMLALLFAGPAFAARDKEPTGQEIAAKARQAQLDTERASINQKGGRPIKFTPARQPKYTKEPEAVAAAENGVVIGVLETQAPGDETGLPPGKYNLFLTKVGNTWHVYVESGGQIVKEAMHVSVERRQGPKPASNKPEFEENGWCHSWCGVDPTFYALTGICFVWSRFCL